MQADEPKFRELKGRLYPWVDEEYGPGQPTHWRFPMGYREDPDRRLREVLEIERTRLELEGRW